jgi:8-oxo-dGTP pyrophosphatase MutT (NUDIX family)
MDRIIPIPKKAATVILLRESKPEGFEVFLLKRHEKSSFMGGNYVYPGGRVDREDGSSEMCSFAKGITREEACHLLGGSLPSDESIAYWIAGVRELFEEAGILLAYDQLGNPFISGKPDAQEKAQGYRQRMGKGKLTICQLAQEENLFWALDQLHYYAHWITPEARSERFDTRFFLALHPEGQVASHDQRETTVGIWLTPRKALEENLKGEVILSPPTLKTIEDLSRFKSIGDLFTSLKKKDIRPVLPVLTKVSEEAVILFPWDPDYELFRAGKIPDPVDHGRPSLPEDNTTRVILRDGRWTPYCRTQ